MTENVHVPVLLAEVIEHLAPRPGARCIDATVNGGGHAAAMLAAIAPDGLLLGIDRDPEVLAGLRARLGPDIAAGRLRLAAGNFADLGALIAAHAFPSADAVLFDLGVSSFHFDLSGRGFSFMREEPLDMRFDAADGRGETAADILASRDAEELTAAFRTYGEERFASRIARSVVARRGARPLATTADLLEVVRLSLPAADRWRAARHAARVFQALRILVNRELEAVERALPQAVDALAPGGRLAIITFHSLEDRLVKHFLRAQAQAGRLRLLTRKPVCPDDAEIAANPRSASAKLRAAEKSTETP